MKTLLKMLICFEVPHERVRPATKVSSKAAPIERAGGRGRDRQRQREREREIVSERVRMTIMECSTVTQAIKWIHDLFFLPVAEFHSLFHASELFDAAVKPHLMDPHGAFVYLQFFSVRTRKFMLTT